MRHFVSGHKDIVGGLQKYVLGAGVVNTYGAAGPVVVLAIALGKFGYQLLSHAPQLKVLVAGQRLHVGRRGLYIHGRGSRAGVASGGLGSGGWGHGLHRLYF